MEIPHRANGRSSLPAILVRGHIVTSEVRVQLRPMRANCMPDFLQCYQHTVQVWPAITAILPPPSRQSIEFAIPGPLT